MAGSVFTYIGHSVKRNAPIATSTAMSRKEWIMRPGQQLTSLKSNTMPEKRPDAF